jgi:multidrug efflux pump subunit AcrA (membrane-fusion protein)
MVSQYGILTYRARSDGSPYAVINRARGTYTKLSTAGDKVDCGDVLYRVNDKPVLLLCGSTPAYRSLSEGANGRDVIELNANLVDLGYATRAQLDPSSGHFGSETASALEKMQSKLGEDQTGSLDLGQAIFLPEPVRIATVTGELGGTAQPGAHVLDATSGTLEVQLALDPSQQDEVKTGDRGQITLPGNTSATGKVDRLGRVAQVPAGQDNNAGGATIPAFISLDHPGQARGLDKAPVQVNITTKGVESALNVPVTAIVGHSGGGYAVEVVRADGRRELVAVKLGLFDNAGGRVQVEGDVRVGDRVVVPSS